MRAALCYSGKVSVCSAIVRGAIGIVSATGFSAQRFYFAHNITLTY
jgi:ABC-type spermidine/putrescine transport system permease subunit II